MSLSKNNEDTKDLPSPNVGSESMYLEGEEVETEKQKKKKSFAPTNLAISKENIKRILPDEFKYNTSMKKTLQHSQKFYDSLQTPVSSNNKKTVTRLEALLNPKLTKKKPKKKKKSKKRRKLSESIFGLDTPPADKKTLNTEDLMPKSLLVVDVLASPVVGSGKRSEPEDDIFSKPKKLPTTQEEREKEELRKKMAAYSEERKKALSSRRPTTMSQKRGGIKGGKKKKKGTKKGFLYSSPKKGKKKKITQSLKPSRVTGPAAGRRGVPRFRKTVSCKANLLGGRKITVPKAVCEKKKRILNKRKTKLENYYL